VYGGASKQTQVRAYRSGVTVLVATPGRLMDLVSSKVISLEHCTFFVLDEADRMLSMGFGAAIQDIVQLVSTPFTAPSASVCEFVFVGTNRAR
jgi:superfamily II DNA/RNA helicase